MRFTTGIGPSPGVSFCNEDAIMTLAATNSCTKGDHLAVEMTEVDSSLRFYKVRTPVAADFTSASGAANLQSWFCVALEDQSTVGGNVRCRFVGEVDALIDDTGLAIGTHLMPKATASATAVRPLDTQTAAVGTGNRSIAILLEATTAASQIKRVYFNGLGLGVGYMITNTT